MGAAMKSMFFSEPLTLKELVERCSGRLPVRIQVLVGYSSGRPHGTLSAADIYNVHFIKHQQVMSIRNSQGNHYSIPLNSSIQFGLLYTALSSTSNSYIDDSSAMFPKVSDIVSLKVLPKVIRATEAYDGPEHISSVVKNEILIVKGIQKTTKFLGRKSLKVYSTTMEIEKLLPADCEAMFSTSPDLTRLLPSIIFARIPNLSPCKAVMYLGESIYNSKEVTIPCSLPASMVTIEKFETETSLIVSSEINTDSTAEDEGEDEEVLLDIPVNESLSRVEIAVMERQMDDETEKLYDNTRTIFENFNPAKLRSFRGTNSESTYTTQSLFYSSLFQGQEQAGLELERPSAAYHTLQPFTSPTLAPDYHSDDENYAFIDDVKPKGAGYNKLQHSTQPQLHDSVRVEECLYEPVDFSDNPVTASSLTVSPCQLSREPGQRDYTLSGHDRRFQSESGVEYESKLDTITHQYHELGAKFEKLQHQYLDLQQQQTLLSPKTHEVATEDSTSGLSRQDKNREILCSMSIAEVSILHG